MVFSSSRIQSCLKVEEDAFEEDGSNLELYFRAFLERYFPVAKMNRLKNGIYGYAQLEGKNLYDKW